MLIGILGLAGMVPFVLLRPKQRGKVGVLLLVQSVGLGVPSNTIPAQRKRQRGCIPPNVIGGVHFSKKDLKMRRQWLKPGILLLWSMFRKSVTRSAVTRVD